MKVSIITATYNSAKTIGDTLASVAQQSYKNVEHLIIDGGSKDDTIAIVNSFPHVSRVESGKDEGIYDAMNKGLAIATGDIVGILNSDDMYASEEILATVVQTIRATGCDAVYGDLVYVDPDNVSRVRRYWKSGNYKHGAFKWGWMPPHPTFFVKRSVYEKYGSFRLGLATASDYELMLRFIHKQRIAVSYIPRVLVRMRDGGASNAALMNRLRANRGDREAWRVNGLSPYWFTLFLKPLRKITQFFLR